MQETGNVIYRDLLAISENGFRSFNSRQRINFTFSINFTFTLCFQIVQLDGDWNTR